MIVALFILAKSVRIYISNQSKGNESKGNADVLMISETNLDDTFSIDQFILEGFNKPFRNDRNINEGDILLFIPKGIPVIVTFMRKYPIGSGGR